MKDGGLAFPGKRYEMLKIAGKDEEEEVSVTYSGMSLRDYAVVHLAAAWVEALSKRYFIDGYTNDDVTIKANQLAKKQADAMIAQRIKEAEDGE